MRVNKRIDIMRITMQLIKPPKVITKQDLLDNKDSLIVLKNIIVANIETTVGDYYSLIVNVSSISNAAKLDIGVIITDSKEKLLKVIENLDYYIDLSDDEFIKVIRSPEYLSDIENIIIACKLGLSVIDVKVATVLEKHNISM